VSLKYEDLILVQPTDYRATYVFRGNSLYDPDYTGTGHQPLLYDQYAAQYGKYRVTATRITVDFTNHSANSAAIAVILPHTDVITFTSWQTMAELPDSKATRSIPVASRLTRIKTCKSTTSGVAGLIDTEVLDEDWSAAVTTTPTQVWYFNIGMESLDQLSDVDMEMRVSMIFDVIFYDRINPGLSSTGTTHVGPPFPSKSSDSQGSRKIDITSTEEPSLTIIGSRGRTVEQDLAEIGKHGSPSSALIEQDEELSPEQLTELAKLVKRCRISVKDVQ
jgi:hypothetical protein